MFKCCPLINAIDKNETITPASDEDVTAYVKVTSTSEITNDGKYLIVCDGSAVGLDGTLGTDMDANNNNKTVTFSDNYVSIPSPDNFYFNITKGEEPGDYVIKTADGVSIGATSDSNSLNTSNSIEYQNTITFEDDGSANIIGSGGAYLRYNNASNANRFRYYKSSTYSGQQAICLYKYFSGTIHHDAEIETTHLANQADHLTAQYAVVKFAKAFNAAMDETENCTSGLSDAWEECQTAYTIFLSDASSDLAYAKNMLKYANAKYSNNDIEACVERMMKTYEICVTKHGQTAFMSEFIQLSPRVSPLIKVIGENTNTIAIIVIISMVSVTAIGGYFFLRKRKENN